MLLGLVLIAAARATWPTPALLDTWRATGCTAVSPVPSWFTTYQSWAEPKVLSDMFAWCTDAKGGDAGHEHGCCGSNTCGAALKCALQAAVTAATTPAPTLPTPVPTSGPARSLSACTGASTQLPAAQCAAWIKFYDGTGGPSWKDTYGSTGPVCPGTRTDPCACQGNAAVSKLPVCNPTGTTVINMCVWTSRPAARPAAARFFLLLGLAFSSQLAAHDFLLTPVSASLHRSPHAQQCPAGLEPQWRNSRGGRRVGRPDAF